MIDRVPAEVSGQERAASPTPLERLCEGVIEGGWLAALVIVPLFFNPYSRQSFDPDKAALLRILVVVMAAAWLVKAGGGGRLAAPSARSVARGRRVPLVVPTLLVALATVASAAASIDVRLSLGGSYHRAQGLWTLLAYLGIFALVLSHLRTASQWRRALYAITVTSFGVASYALLQRLGLDPIPWTQRPSRVGSTLGNAIFLGGFLALAIFPMARAMASRARAWARARPGASSRAAHLTVAVVLGYNLVLAGMAIVVAQSRGPLLGVFAGAFIGGLAILLHLRHSASTWSPGWRPWIARRAWAVLVAVCIGSVSLAWVASQPGSLLSWARDLPYVGRLTTPFDLTSGSVQVRRLIWQGGLELLRERLALGEWEETATARRLLLGHGPETFHLAFARVHPPRLTHFDDPLAVPDRGHNEALDRLVTGGLFGFLAWFGWYGALFYAASRWLFSGARGRVVLFWSCFTAGAALGAGLPVVLGGPELAFAGLPAGMLGGVATFLVVASRRGPETGSEPSRWGSRETLLVALLAAAAAHLIETDLGIGVTATKLYLWFFAAVLVAVGEGWLGSAQDTAGIEDSPARAGAASRLALAAGLLAALAVSTLVFALLQNLGGASSTVAVLRGNLSGRAAIGPIGAALWLPLLTWIGAAGAASILDPLASRSRRGVAGRRFTVISLGVAALYTLLQAHRLSETSRLRAAGTPLLEVFEHISGHVAAYVVFVIVWLLAIGLALAASGGRISCRRPVAAAVTGVCVTTAGAWLVATWLRPLAADTLAKQGAALAGVGRPEAALPVLRRAVELAPGEPRHLLERGRVAVEAAREADAGPRRRAWLEEARASFERARNLAPLDPDHPANLARLYAIRAELAPDDAARSIEIDRAAAKFREALRLRPAWVRLLSEYALLRHRAGSSGEAFGLVARALELDPEDPQALRTLAALHAAQARAAEEAGDGARAAEHHARAAAALLRVRALGERAYR